jgi:hypothetical protein
MNEFWLSNGIYLWGLTTALVIIALVWLAWLTFSERNEEPNAEVTADLQAQVTELAEATPLMRATLGRAYQFCGIVRFNESASGAGFAVAFVNARGEGVVLSSYANGQAAAKPLKDWGSVIALSAEEKSAIDDARRQKV